MQIQLKQAEIVTALKQYVANQGINLVGKEVSISFTAGRKEAGVIADLVIEDAVIPGFTNSPADDAPKAAPLTLVTAPAPVAGAAPEVQAAAEAPAVEEAPEAPKATPNSLFN
jgi:hypothetical protein